MCGSAEEQEKEGVRGRRREREKRERNDLMRHPQIEALASKRSGWVTLQNNHTKAGTGQSTCQTSNASTHDDEVV
jgi:hypothetical protein